MANNSEEGQGSQMAVVPVMMMMFVPQRKHTYRPPLPVTGIVLYFYM
jgi:hypothetical protein